MLINEIIPKNQYKFGIKQGLDLESICVFVALGYFFGDNTYFKGFKSLLPGRIYKIDCETIIGSEEYFKWSYEPNYRAFEDIYEEFVSLFEESIRTMSGDLTIPISGGLDSRTLVVAANKLRKNIRGYSYHFENGWNESKYGEKMSKYLGFPFKMFELKNGMLWDYIDDLALRNGCYSEFTHPRQYAFYQELKEFCNGSTLLLGHGGDLFFDGQNIPEKLSLIGQEKLLFQKMVKPSGFELASELWKHWGLNGDFRKFLSDQINRGYHEIDIQNNNAHFRAFKNRFYVPRWTGVNLDIFKDFGNVALPYFTDEMCRFICKVPENILFGRKLQIEYIKRNNSFLAAMEWESNKPFNLYNSKFNRFPFNMPYRIIQRLRRPIIQNNYIQSNWQLQFLGDVNKQKLNMRLLSLNNLVDEQLIKYFIDNFEKYPKKYFHAITMLLTLAEFNNKFK
jgi:asparagine synthetase B (glutamine-hydrolysing)